MTLLLGSQLVSIEGATDAFIVACVNVDINFYVLPSINTGGSNYVGNGSGFSSTANALTMLRWRVIDGWGTMSFSCVEQAVSFSTVGGRRLIKCWRASNSPMG